MARSLCLALAGSPQVCRLNQPGMREEGLQHFAPAAALLPNSLFEAAFRIGVSSSSVEHELPGPSQVLLQICLDCPALH